jgi:hypothetical protein
MSTPSETGFSAFPRIERVHAQPAKPFTFRVAKVRPCATAIAHGHVSIRSTLNRAMIVPGSLQNQAGTGKRRSHEKVCKVQFGPSGSALFRRQGFEGLHQNVFDVSEGAAIDPPLAPTVEAEIVL